MKARLDHGSPPRLTGLGTSLTVAGHLTGLIGRLRRWNELARQRQALRAMDAHLLADIGVCEKQAAREAQRPFWDDPVTADDLKPRTAHGRLF